MSAPRWDIFCCVVDNYGDAAVCWRLARELSARDVGCDAAHVRLWIDQPATLAALWPGVDAGREAQTVEGVHIVLWRDEMAWDAVQPGDMVVEAFACGLPEGYVEAMARRQPTSQWVVLEYLSAEPWVATHHGLPSPHPRLALSRHYFFPGFTEQTGGLLKEAGYDAAREAFVRNRTSRAAFWRKLGFESPTDNARTVSLFGYDNPGLDALSQIWSAGDEPTVIAVPPGPLRSRLLTWFDAPQAGDGRVLRRGNLEARLLPFLPQPDYDELLWACDWNFVRGEDSFVRASWAGRPFVWHIYPQAGQAHWVKLDAFLDRWCQGLSEPAAAAVRHFWRSWNGVGDGVGGVGDARSDCGPAWQAMASFHEEILGHARKWPIALAQAGNLAQKLAAFCADRLQSRPS